MQENIRVPKLYLDIINQIFEIEKKLTKVQEPNSIQRNVNKLREILENDLSDNGGSPIGLMYYNPLGEVYNETRTDCEASIAGSNTDDLVITDVIKPIIRYRQGGMNLIVQKGIVIVESNQKN
ncbi:hypothetical protein [Fibrivirga algicola]|uniref:Uncharacterized protein n=1 Tax=Fibrivirga algicola TaxID=2950420 RepID=A0ABX0QN00_9BACT|nr:hypothetical protein [Fibrivirga algicola]NID13516.1 hypothetical protein [Fibrivirga algicola]